MTAPDRDAIRAALIANGVIEEPQPGATDGIHSWRCAYPEQFGPCRCLDELVGDVAALMEDYAADLRAEVERLRYAHHACDQERIHQMSRAEAAEADRDAYAAERVRAALTDVAQMLMAESERESTGSRHLHYADAATRVLHHRDRAGAS